MKKKIIIGMLVFIVLFVVLDYCELLPYLHKDGAISVPFRFQIFDTHDNPVSNVTITTFVNDRDLKSPFEYDDDNASIILGYIRFGAGWKETFLFKKPSPYGTIKNREVKFVFQHPDYLEQEKGFLVKNLKTLQKIVLKPKEQMNEKD